MFTRTFLLASSLTLLGVAYASPALQIRDSTITLPAAKRVNTTGIIKLVPHDRARAQKLKASKGGLQPETIVGSLPATNQAVDYVVNVSRMYLDVANCSKSRCRYKSETRRRLVSDRVIQSMFYEYSRVYRFPSCRYGKFEHMGWRHEALRGDFYQRANS